MDRGCSPYLAQRVSKFGLDGALQGEPCSHRTRWLCYARQNTENYTYSEFVQVYYAAFLVTKSSRDVASSPSLMLPAAQHACWRLSDRKMPAVVCAQLPSISSKPSPIKAVTGVADSTRTATATTESRDPRGGGWRRERATRPQGPGGTAAASTV